MTNQTKWPKSKKKNSNKYSLRSQNNKRRQGKKPILGKKKVTNNPQRLQKQENIPFVVIYDSNDRYKPPLRFMRASKIADSTDISRATEEISGSFIIPGVNKISAEEWTYIQQNPDAQSFLDKRILYAIYGHGNTNTDSLEDYSEENAKIIVLFTYSDEELVIQLSRERRRSVLEAIRSQQGFLLGERENKGLKMVEI